MKKYFHTPSEIQKMFVERGLPKNFCIVPFTNLIFNPGGHVSVCRQKGTDHTVGHLDRNTVDQIWNNDYMQRWRQEFLSGHVQICASEQLHHACHLSASNYHFFDETESYDIQQKELLKITANFNGKCNLKCKMCHIWSMENDFYKEENFWQEADVRFFPHIKELEMLSGEPFIQKDTYKLIERVSSVNSNCLWSFTTNGHWKLTSSISEKLDKIHIKNIIVSVDSLQEKRFADIRRGGSLDFLQQNLETLILYEKKRIERGLSELGITIHFLAMRENFDEAIDILKFCKSKGLRHTLRLLNVPDELSALNLPYEERKKIVVSYVEKCGFENLTKSSRILIPMIESLTDIDRASVLMTMYDKKLSHARSVE